MTFENQTPSLRVDIENPKLDIQKKDNMRMVKLAKMTDFRAILQSKSDINIKIAKILTNAINWKLDFTGNRGSKLSFTLPLQGETSLTKSMNIHSLNSPRPMTDILNQNSVREIDHKEADDDIES